MNRPITSNETETVIKNLPRNRSPGPDDFTGGFYPTFREELTPILLKIFQKIVEEGTVPNSFCEATIILPKADNDTTKKEIIKIRSEINEKEMKETIAKINKTKN